MKPYPHQQKVIEEDPLKALLAFGCGTGKTFLSLALARGSTLVVCPKTIRDDRVWERQLEKMATQGNMELINGEVVISVKHHINLTVLSKEEFKRDYLKLERFDTVIFDESHTVCGLTANVRYVKKQPIPKASQLFDACLEYLKKCPPERLYLCTATPIKGPMAVLGAAWLLGKNWDFYNWRNIFMIKLPMPGRAEIWAPKKDTETKNRLAKVVQSLGYTGKLSDFNEIPEQVFITKHVELTEKQKKRIKELYTEYPDPLVLLSKKSQVENGILSGDEFNKSEVFENQKIEKILDLALEFPRLVIFAKYTAQIEQIVKVLKKKEYNVEILNGQTKNRGELIARVNESEKCIIVIQSSISEGYEFPQYPVMVFASLDWSVVSYIQAQGRILRSNFIKSNLYIHLVVKGGIDEHIYNSIMNKQDFNTRIFLKL